MTHRGPFQPLPFCDSVIMKCEMKKRLSGQGGEEAGPLLCSLICELSRSHTSLGRRDVHRHLCFELALHFEFHQVVGNWVITGLGCSNGIASKVSV